MTKKEICLSHDTIATYSICVWVFIEIKAIDGDSVYFVSHAGDEINYHKARIYYDNSGDYEDKSYFMWGKIKILLFECMRVM